MAYTGKLGVTDSRLGSIALGAMGGGGATTYYGLGQAQTYILPRVGTGQAQALINQGFGLGQAQTSIYDARAPKFEAAGPFSTGTGDITVAWPPHNIGDIGLLFIESTGGQAANLGTPAGFAAVDNSPQSTGATTAGTRITVYWCRATSTSMASPVVTDPSDHAMGVILRFSGVQESFNPWNITGGGVKASASTSVAITGVTTTVDNTLIVAGFTHSIDSGGAFASGWTNNTLISLLEQFDNGSTVGNGGGIAIATGTLYTAGASGTIDATTISSVNAFLTIALNPPIRQLAQAQARIVNPNTQKYANAQARMTGTIVQAYAQAASKITPWRYGFGQARAAIFFPYGLGQAQGHVGGLFLGRAQAQAHIKQTYLAHAQAQAYMLPGLRWQFANAGALITNAYPNTSMIRFMDAGEGYNTSGGGYYWSSFAASQGVLNSKSYVSYSNFNGVTQVVPSGKYVVAGGKMDFNSQIAGNPFMNLANGATENIQLEFAGSSLINIFRNGSLIGTSDVPFTDAPFKVANNIWVPIEVRANIDSSTGYVHIYLNGCLYYSLTGVNTNSSGGVVDRARWENNYSSSGTASTDHYIITSNNEYDIPTPIGAPIIHTLFASSDGSYSGWTPNTGTTRYTVIDETALNTSTDWISSTVENDIVTVMMQRRSGISFPSNQERILAVELGIVAQSVVGTGTIAPILKKGAEEFIGESRSVTAGAFVYYRWVFPYSPFVGEGNWLRTTMDTMEVGAKLLSPVAEIQISQIIIKTLSLGSLAHGQAQAQIIGVGYPTAQAQAQLISIGYGLGQAQADILTIYYAHAQAQADIFAIAKQVFGQAQAYTLGITFTHAQAQAHIFATTVMVAQAQANIKQTYQSVAQANAYIKLEQQSYAQAQALMTWHFALAQTQASIAIPAQQFAIAQAVIFRDPTPRPTTPVNVMVYKNGLRNTSRYSIGNAAWEMMPDGKRILWRADFDDEDILIVEKENDSA